MQMWAARRPGRHLESVAAKAPRAPARRRRPPGARLNFMAATLVIITTHYYYYSSSFGSVNALEVSVSIPELVKLNDAFWLNCSLGERSAGARLEPSVQSEEERIYSIKWYKDEEEFYRYLPSAEPKVSTYETKGISLDQAKSYEGNVHLTKADVYTEGIYRCEALSEAPQFETVRKSKQLRVYAAPVRNPRIEILDSNGRVKNPKTLEISFDVGDKIELRCNSAPSKPAARLRWYLNEREIVIPSGQPPGLESNRSGGGGSSNNINNYNGPISSARTQRHTHDQGNVRVTPIEYRFHYKHIYSSHSTLSLVLQREDLINNRISLKCLASVRLEVPVTSKQLIVLTPGGGGAASARRARRELATPEGRAAAHRHRAQQQQQQQRPGAAQLSRQLNGELAAPTLLYLHEDSRSTLGPSAIKLLGDQLERQLRGLLQGRQLEAVEQLEAAEFNRLDNLDYAQAMRERLTRARSAPPAQLLNFTGSSAGNGSTSSKRLYGLGAHTRSPLYLDEYDSLRPVISWPPFPAGRLVAPPGGQPLVALLGPNRQPAVRGRDEPTWALAPTGGRTLALYGGERAPGVGLTTQPPLERLLEQLNCTCTESSIDTKLGWQVNELPVNQRDTRHYPTRVSPDHRQTWLTIGLWPYLGAELAAQSSPSSAAHALASLLAPYLKAPVGSNRIQQVPPASGTVAAESGQLKIGCQAIHSLLLFSGSETMTFDFNPSPALDMDASNAVDKLSSNSRNVIPAATASPARSAAGRASTQTLISSMGSHTHNHQLVALASATISALTVAMQWYNPHRHQHQRTI